MSTFTHRPLDPCQRVILSSDRVTMCGFTHHRHTVECCSSTDAVAALRMTPMLGECDGGARSVRQANVAAQSRRFSASAVLNTPAMRVPQFLQQPSFSRFDITECHERVMTTCLHPGQIVFAPSE